LESNVEKKYVKIEDKAKGLKLKLKMFRIGDEESE